MPEEETTMDSNNEAGKSEESPVVLEQPRHKISLDSTKLAPSEHLIVCKSPGASDDSLIMRKMSKENEQDFLLYSGVMQFVFGFFMLVAGGVVLHYDAALAQVGGGIWAGCLAMSTGITGVLASAREWCPLRSAPQKITHTIFLALSLVSLALSQLVMALAATGATRDLKSNNEFENETIWNLPKNYLSILSNCALFVAAFGEFISAAVSSYKSSRILCPCFRRNADEYQQDFGGDCSREAMVHSWLGRHSPPVYIVASSTMGKGSKISGRVTPIFVQPPPPMYSLIPAPLGQIPSPIIPPTNMRKKPRQKQYAHPRPPSRPANPKNSKPPKKEKKKFTELDAVKTYTGLDRAMAEEFIDICDSRNVSLCCSDSSCDQECQNSNCCNNHGCVPINHGDGHSREFLVENNTK